jgi:hypothetical protein
MPRCNGTPYSQPPSARDETSTAIPPRNELRASHISRIWQKVLDIPIQHHFLAKSADNAVYVHRLGKSYNTSNGFEIGFSNSE